MSAHTEDVDAVAPTCEHGPLIVGCPACDAEAVRRIGPEYMAARDARLLAEVEPEWGPNLLAMSPEDRAGWVALKRRAEAAEAKTARAIEERDASIERANFLRDQLEQTTQKLADVRAETARLCHDIEALAEEMDHGSDHDRAYVGLRLRAALAAERDPEPPTADGPSW